MLRNKDIRILLKSTGMADYKQTDHLNWIRQVKRILERIPEITFTCSPRGTTDEIILRSKLKDSRKRTSINKYLWSKGRKQ
jgi:hypothetical protein